MSRNTYSIYRWYEEGDKPGIGDLIPVGYTGNERGWKTVRITLDFGPTGQVEEFNDAKIYCHLIKVEDLT